MPNPLPPREVSGFGIPGGLGGGERIYRRIRTKLGHREEEEHIWGEEGSIPLLKRKRAPHIWGERGALNH